MEIMYAKVPHYDYPCSIEQTEPINFMGYLYYGFKVNPLKEIKDENDKVTLEPDPDGKTVYDELTQLIMDRDNLKSQNIDLGNLIIDTQTQLEDSQAKNEDLANLVVELQNQIESKGGN